MLYAFNDDNLTKHILSLTKLANHPLCLFLHFEKEVFELEETNATFPNRMLTETSFDLREKKA